MRIERLDLLAPDPEALAAFYGDRLGLKVLARGPSEAAMQAGHTRLAFTRAPAGWPGVYHFAFNIPDNQLAAAKAWLAEWAPLTTSGDGEDEFSFPNWDAHAVYSYDPAGNLIELIARHSLESASAMAFGGGSLLGVSEIGLATADVPVLVEALARAPGLKVFRGTLSDGFAAVGGETGLFVLVSEGRRWFPDLRVPAGPWPVRVAAVTDAGRTFTLSGPPYSVG